MTLATKWIAGILVGYNLLVLAANGFIKFVDPEILTLDPQDDTQTTIMKYAAVNLGLAIALIYSLSRKKSHQHIAADAPEPAVRS